MKKLDELSYKQWDEFNNVMTVRPHSNLVQMLGICAESGAPLCMVMEYMTHGTLANYLKDHQPTPEQALAFCKGIAAGLHHIHLQNVLHKNLRAQNILLTDNLTVKIAGKLE